eukprot:417357-Alexandrium_andersonii.AAC.1
MPQVWCERCPKCDRQPASVIDAPRDDVYGGVDVFFADALTLDQSAPDEAPVLRARVVLSRLRVGAVLR